ncbi:Uncharacterised protein [uncultured archaeon]|nr:Uncharacterised protein [uncultured archaeon]
MGRIFKSGRAERTCSREEGQDRTEKGSVLAALARPLENFRGSLSQLRRSKGYAEFTDGMKTTGIRAVGVLSFVYGVTEISEHAALSAVNPVAAQAAVIEGAVFVAMGAIVVFCPLRARANDMV